MSNESSHGNNHQSDNKQPAMSFKAAGWFIIIVAGLFICAVNFVKVMSNEKEEGKTENKTEMTKPASEGEMKPAASENKAAEKAADTAHAEKH